MDWGAVANVPFVVALLAIIIATVTDIRKHEVPDWVSYTTIALGLLFAAAHSIIYRDWTILYSLIGLAVGYGLGALLYYTGQWGGGDAKLLMGIGALLTLPVAWVRTVTLEQLLTLELHVPLFVKFIGLLAICGAAYGLIWMLVLIIRNRKRFKGFYVKKLHEYKTYRYIVLVVAFVLLLAAAAFGTGALGRASVLAGALTLLLAALLYGSFYMIVAVRVAEEQFMLKSIKAKQLTEGDWVVGGVHLGKEWIIPENNIGATKEQIALLKKRAPEHQVTIKEGIPFVPSFLAAIIVAVL